MAANTTSIMDLLSRIRNSDQLVLPDIQRDFVWKEDQIRLLLDSHMRGYPIGALLFWQTQWVEVSYRTFVRDYKPGMTFVTSTKPAKKRLEMVLDGQQRLQSLYIAAFGSYNGRHLCFNVTSGAAADEEDSEGASYRFEFWSDADTNRPHRLLRVSEILSWPGSQEDIRIDDVVAGLRLSPEEGQVARRNMRTLRRVFTQGDLVPVETIDNDIYDERSARSIDDVVEIFVRVNSGGTRLSRSDLMFSLLKSKWRGARERFDDVIGRVDADGVLGIDKDFMIRGLLTVADAPPSYDVENIKRHGEAVESIFDKFATALQTTIDFVRDEGIISGSLLSPVSTLFPIIYYLAHQSNGSVPDAERQPLRTFLYLLLFNGFLKGKKPDARIRYLREVLQRGKGGPLPLERLVNVISSRQKWTYTVTSDGLLNENVRLALNIAQPRACRETLTWQSKAEVDHIYPQSKYRDAYGPLVDDIGNFGFLGKLRNIRKSAEVPWVYFANVSDDELRDLYLIERAELGPDCFETFVANRRARILDRVQTFLGR